MRRVFACESCGWEWPRAEKPPADAECDDCGGSIERVDSYFVRMADLAETMGKALLPRNRAAIATAIDIEEKRATAEVVGFDFEPVLEDARTISKTTPLPWSTVWPKVWERAFAAACRGETPGRVTVEWREGLGGFEIVPASDAARS